MRCTGKQDFVSYPIIFDLFILIFQQITHKGTIIAAHDNPYQYPVPNKAESRPNSMVTPNNRGTRHTFLKVVFIVAQF